MPPKRPSARASTSTRSSATCCRCSSTSSRRAASRFAASSAAEPVPVDRLRVQAAAGVPQPLPQRPRCDAERRLADDCDAGRRRRGGGGGVRHRRTASPPEHLARIYDPFFTTKADRPGHRPGPVDHLRHRARARSLHSVRQRARPGHALHAAVRGGADGTSAAAPPRPAAEHGRLTMRRNASVLVIDDEEIMREILEHAARARGLQRAPRRLGAGRPRPRPVAAVRRGDRRRDDARHRRPAGARRAARSTTTSCRC